MELIDGPDEARFRDGLRTWLAEQLPADLRDSSGDGSAPDGERWRAYSRALHAAGYAGLAWPVEHGGRALPARYRAIAAQEEARAGAPSHVGLVGIDVVGPTVIAHGDTSQQARLLPPILSAEETWCAALGDDESGAGETAGLPEARFEADRVVLRGRVPAMRTGSTAADRCLLVARDVAAGGHACTVLALDLRQRGVELPAATPGDAPELVLDDAVVLPADVLARGEAGARAVETALRHDRVCSGLALLARLETHLADLVELGRDRGASALQRDAIARCWIETRALSRTASRVLETLDGDDPPAADPALVVLAATDADRRVIALALDLLAEDAQLLPPSAPYGGAWPLRQLRGRHDAARVRSLRAAVAERLLHPPSSGGRAGLGQGSLGDELRAQARVALADDAAPTWDRLAGLGWPGLAVPEHLGGAGLGFLEEVVLHEEAGRALLHAPFLSTMALAPFLPEDEQREVASGRHSWTLADGPLVRDLDTATHVAVPGGDTIWELVDAERELLATRDASRPLGVVVGGEIGRALCPSTALPAIRARVLTALAFEALGVGGRALELALADRGSRAVGEETLADVAVALEQARSLAWWAAWCVAEQTPDGRVVAAAAKATAAEAAVTACERTLAAGDRSAPDVADSLERLLARALGIAVTEAAGETLRAEVAAHLLDRRGAP